MPDLSRATDLTPEVLTTIDDMMFEHHKWNEEQILAGVAIRGALALAVQTIIENAPPSPDRCAAIRKCREARMDANSAITHGGKY